MKVKTTAKKVLSLMLCAMMLLSVMSIGFTAGAAECDHPNLSESNWEVRRKTTCQKAGLEVQWCYDCGEWVEREMPFDGNAHVTGEWETITPSTCQKEGYEAVYCIYGCTDENGKPIVLAERTIPAHDYQVVFRQAPTCTKEGYEFVACLTCYDMKTVTYEIDPLAHSFTAWEIIDEATCVDGSGKRERICTACGHKETDSFTDSENHVNITWYEDKKLASTCDAPGYIPGVCNDCGETVTKELAQHSESPSVLLERVESTCATNGTERRLCECGLEFDVELPLNPENHVYSEWRVTKQASCTEGERYKFCIYHYDEQIVEKIPANGEHNYGEWTSVIEPDCSKTGLDKRVCADCSKEETRELPTKHDYGTWTTIAEVCCDETKLSNGTKLAKCDNCSFEKYFTIPSVHTFSEWRIVVKADCKNINKPGTMQRTCTACGKVESKEYYAEHDFTDWYVTGQPVCAEGDASGRTGTYTRWCQHCKATEQKAIPVTHEYVDVEIIKYPQCNKDGSLVTGEMLTKCKFCDETKIAEIPAEHKFGEWETVTESTCTTSGSRQHECLICGYKVTEEIPAGHAYGNWYSDVGFTCESGKTAELMRKCANCSVIEKKTVSLNHPNKVTVTTEATCTTSGYTREICPDCGNITVVGEITPAKGHTLDERWTSKHQATCNSEGSRYKACADCDYLEYQLIERTEHQLIEIKPGLEPTCTESGYSSESFCGVCRQTFPSVELAPLGHDIAEGEEICSRCKAYKDTDCGCSCHSTSGMEKIFFELINKLYQLFGINQQCSCGVLHYEEPGFFAKLFGNA